MDLFPREELRQNAAGKAGISQGLAASAENRRNRTGANQPRGMQIPSQADQELSDVQEEILWRLAYVTRLLIFVFGGGILVAANLPTAARNSRIDCPVAIPLGRCAVALSSSAISLFKQFLCPL